MPCLMVIFALWLSRTLSTTRSSILQKMVSLRWGRCRWTMSSALSFTRTLSWKWVKVRSGKNCTGYDYERVISILSQLEMSEKCASGTVVIRDNTASSSPFTGVDTFNLLKNGLIPHKSGIQRSRLYIPTWISYFLRVWNRNHQTSQLLFRCKAVCFAATIWPVCVFFCQG